MFNFEDVSNFGLFDDLIINYNKFVLVGIVEVGVIIYIYVDEKIVVNVFVFEDGIWFYQFDNVLKDSEYFICVVVEDLVGNMVELFCLFVMIDISMFIDNFVMVVGFDNGIFSNDSIMSQIWFMFSIFGEMNQSVQIFIDGVLVDMIMVMDRN